MSIVRRLEQRDVREHDKVSSQAFVYSCDINDKNSVLPSEIMLGAFFDDNRTLMADMEIGDRKCIYGNSVLRCAAVGGVASKPEYRGKGAVKALFSELFKENWDISILYPFSDAYYRRLGYESIGRALKITFPFKELCGVSRVSGCTLFEGENGDKLLKIYNGYARKNNLCFIREDLSAYSDNPYESCQYTYFFDKSYVTFSTSRQDSTVYVKEIIYLDREALEQALGFLRNFEGNYDTLVFEKLPFNTPIVGYIADESKAELICKSTGAARIINVENVLKAHRYPEAEGSFIIEIQDNGIFEVKYKNTKADVVRADSKNPEVSMNINAASKIILSGISSVEEAEYMHGITIRSEDSDFFKAFPKNDGFLNDEF